MGAARDGAQLKMRLKVAMDHYIYGPFEGYYQRELAAIIEQNDVISCMTRYVFTYKAVKYTQHRFKRPPQNIPRLVPELHERMDKLLDEKLRIERDEKPLVMGYVLRVLNSSADVAEVLRAFPTTLKPPIEATMLAAGVEFTHLGTDEAAHAVNASATCSKALKLRLMTNLLLATR